MNRYDRYPGDYLRHTLTLTLAQDGAYTRLMDYYYSTERAIPVDEAMAAARCRNAGDESITQWVLDRFFKLTDLGYRHDRIEQEIEKARPRIEAAKRNGIKGGRPKKNPLGSSWVSQMEPTNNPGRKLPSPSPSDKLESAYADLLPEAPATDGGKNAKGANCPVQRIVAAYHAALPELSPVRALPEQTVKMIRTRWREDPERQTLDWWTSFFSYVRECPFLVGQVNGFQADLLWLVRPTNFAKVLNGNYERGADNARAH